MVERIQGKERTMEPQVTAAPQPPVANNTAATADLNDKARNGQLDNARIVFTSHLMAHLVRNATNDLKRAAAKLLGQQQVMAKMRAATFHEDNDPHGGHDFGSLEHDDTKIFWKIDVYENDGTFQWGAAQPWDSETSYRIVTVMLASDY